MTEPWSEYVPNRLVELLHVHGGELPVGLLERRTAVVLFADVAGFTSMSRAATNAADYGTEEVTQLLNDCFELIGEVVSTEHGDIVQFAGDAVTVTWGTEELGATAHRQAIQCAFRMQVALDGLRPRGTSVGTFLPAFRIGITAGPVVSAIVGDPPHRLYHVMLGEAIDRAAVVCQKADPGCVAADNSILLPDERIEYDAVRGVLVFRNWPVMDGHRPRNRQPISGAPAWQARPPAGMGIFLDPVIAQRLATGQRTLLSEHRNVTVAFIRLPDVDPDDSGIARLQALVVRATEAITRYGGSLLRVGTGDKGTVLLASFGAPRSHEDNEERAVHCCVELVSSLGEQLQAGISSGPAFCGEIGSRARREYSAFGDSVNLAARLMQRANSGQVLIDAATHERVTSTAVGDHLQPINVKGRAGRVNVWSISTIRDHPPIAMTALESGVPLIGRAKEMEQLQHLLELAAADSGQVVCLTGDAGIGKSRLAAEVVGRARRAGFRVLGGACRSHTATSSYYAWRSIWAAILGVDRSGTVELQAAQLDVSLTGLGPEWRQRAPLLAPILNLALPDTDLTASLDPKTRAKLAQSLLLDRLQAALAKQPMLLVLEDCHWIDEASRVLLDLLARNAFHLPLLVIITARQPVIAEDLLPTSGAMPHVHNLLIGKLAAKDIQLLAERQLVAQYGPEVTLSPEVVLQLAQRADGNSFFLEELIKLFRAHTKDPADIHAVESLDPPQGISRILLARLAQLTEPEMQTIKVASAIGSRFRGSWIAGSWFERDDPSEVAARLRRLEQLDIVRRQSMAGVEPEYEFRHGITHDVVYEVLTNEQREALHRRIGTFIEETYGGELSRWVFELAHHWGRTKDVDQQRRWFRVAADAAKAAFANADAIDYFRRLIDLLPDKATGEARLELGSLLHLIGRWQEAEQSYRDAIRVAQRIDAHSLRAAGECEFGTLLTYTKTYSEAQATLTRSAQTFEELGELEGLAKALDRLAFTLYQQGEYIEALVTAERHRRLASGARDLSGVSAALDKIGLIHRLNGRWLEADEALQEALSMAVQAGDRPALIHAANDLAGLHYERGDYPAAAKHLHQSLETANEIGYRWAQAVAVHNLGELYREWGSYEQAEACFTNSLRIAIELGDFTLMTSSVGSMAVVAAEQDHVTRANELFDRAITLARSLDAPYFLGEWLHRKARLMAVVGQVDDAQQLNDEAEWVGSQGQDHEVQWRTRLLGIEIARSAGRMESRAAIQEIQTLARQWTEPPAQAAALTAICRLDSSDTSAREQAVGLILELCGHTPSVEYRNMYQELTGDVLPVRTTLPPLAEFVAYEHAELDELLTEVDISILQLKLVGRKASASSGS